MRGTIKWLKTALIAAAGGGFMGAFTAAMDPSKYSFPHDFGSGKLWKYFVAGAGVMFIGLVIQSPMGQKFMSTFKQTQADLAASKQSIEATKAELKGGPNPNQNQKAP